jgi:flagellar basal-body rod protein FlgG
MSSYGLWLSAAGMMVQDHRQAIYANNLANLNTTGFKQDLAVIRQRSVESREGVGDPQLAHPVLDQLPGGLNVRSPYHDLEQGRLERTGRALDVAIDGKGFFVVGDGKVTRYTRDGEFTINAEGELVLSAGNGRWHVLDDSGAPISIDPTGGAVAISEDGVIRQNGNDVAMLGLMWPVREQGLRKQGENVFAAENTEMKPAAARVVAEFREESNAEVMSGLVAMIEASRAYELNAKLVQMQDEMTGQAVTTVGRVT